MTRSTPDSVKVYTVILGLASADRGLPMTINCVGFNSRKIVSCSSLISHGSSTEPTRH
jgi:hypothetical protein